jgi:hypothetical protein
MNLKEMKRKVLALIEELNIEKVELTDDSDISTKLNDVINQIMFEVCRIKRLPKYVEIDVKEGDLIDFVTLERRCGYEVFQVSKISGVNFTPRADGTLFQMLEDGIAEIELYVYPERITSKTNDSYEFELTADVLEVMPFGIAGDLLSADISNNYGRVYKERYESQLSRLDTRHSLGTIYIEGGVI